MTNEPWFAFLRLNQVYVRMYVIDQFRNFTHVLPARRFVLTSLLLPQINEKKIHQNQVK